MLASDKLLHIRSRSKETADTMAPQSKAFVREIEILSEDEAALVQISKLLGSGGFGSVYEGKYRGKTVAVKKMNTNSKNPRAVLQSFQAETSIASFCHPHIVRTIAASSLDRPLSDRMIIMEFAGSRTLRNILDNEKEVIDEERRMKFASHITMALEFIHGQDIAHLDVKPANILVDSKDVCKLGDFGCSQILDEGDENLPASPTYSYLTAQGRNSDSESGHLFSGNLPLAIVDERTAVRIGKSICCCVRCCCVQSATTCTKRRPDFMSLSTISGKPMAGQSMFKTHR